MTRLTTMARTGRLTNRSVKRIDDSAKTGKVEKWRSGEVEKWKK
jgi:hypothetical protein